MSYNREFLQLASKNHISKHFTVKDVCYSDTALAKGISNIPTATVVINATLLAVNILEDIVNHYGKNLNVHCIYRSPGPNGVNHAVGGVDNSQHCLGQACDFTIDGISTKQIFNDIISGKIKQTNGKPIKDITDQCIYENNGAWVHISFDQSKSRKQFMTALNGKYTSVFKEI